ncbi:hypothetical protein AS361_03770 [Myroides marinus]|uniref:hypothetical protein n=1 Tax=Myroides marinus TaxID=703342 RepID=UPI000741BE43|nr:hypothetical protein [Myroides marinus]KUF38975.1 hypothetical protein AS361_03770 [Myroides marinus]
MQVNIKYWMIFLFILQSSIAQIKDPIVLSIDNSTTLSVDTNDKYNYILIDVQEENNLISKVTFSHINYDINIQYCFQTIDSISSLDTDVKHQEMDILNFISFSNQKYKELNESQKHNNLPHIESIGSLTFNNVILKDDRDEKNIKYYKTTNKNTSGFMNKHFD